MEDKFTLDDAENDGLIKREVGKQLASNFKRRGGELWLAFQTVCDEMGREPWEVLGDHAIRAINNPGHSERLFNTQIDMNKVKQDQMRKEDAQFVMEMMEAFGVNEQEENKDVVDQIIEQRIQSAANPMGPLSKASNNNDSEVTQEDMAQLMNEVSSLRDEIRSGDSGGGEGKQDLDEVLEDDNETETVQVEDTTEEPEPEPEPEPEQEPVEVVEQEQEVVEADNEGLPDDPTDGFDLMDEDGDVNIPDSSDGSQEEEEA